MASPKNNWQLSKARAVFLAVLFLSCCQVRGLYEECQNADGEFAACHPDIEKLVPAGNFTVTLDPEDSTCGTPRSSYRRLGDRMFVDKICDALSTDVNINHDVSYMTDVAGDTTWWQSVTMETAGPTQPLLVNITLSFNKTYHLMGDLTITFNSGRPEVMILEKSVDYGVTWSPLQYYARNCREFYDRGAGYSITVNDLSAVICDNTSVEITSFPRPGGKVIFGAVGQRLKLLAGPTEENFAQYFQSLDTSDVMEFLSFTDLRIRLLETATDGGTNYNMYYYAISDIEVLARCDCNLHGSRCVADETGRAACECSHNTAGRDCELCQPLYNDRPWQKGLYTPFSTGTANECKKCECNEHADSCVYDPVYGRGVCQDCQHNTTGRHCERCMLGFFPNETLPVNDTSRCADCDCEVLGTVAGSQECSQVANFPSPIGQCQCRPLVTGRRCDQCDAGYYGLLMQDSPGVCKACACDEDGTENGSDVCAQDDGQCPCKASTSGRGCELCADGYYNFPRGEPNRGCLACGCDPGGAASTVCDVLMGACSCRAHLEGLKCDQVEAGFFVPALDDVIYQPQTTTGCDIGSDLWTSEKPFDGGVLALCDVTSNVSVQFQPVVGGQKQLELAWPYYLGLRYTVPTNGSDVTLSGTLSVSVNGNSGADVTSYGTDVTTCQQTPAEVQRVDFNFTSGVAVAWVSDNVTVPIDVRCRYDVTLSISGNGNVISPVVIDSFLLMPALTSSSGNTTFGVHSSSETDVVYHTCLNQLAALFTRESALLPGTCRNLFLSVSAELYNGGQACDCDPVGTEPGTLCAAVGGQCHCKPGVAGRRCDQCRPGYYDLTLSGCTACDCDQGGSRNGACDVISGQCQCLQNVASAMETGTSGVAGDLQCSQCRQNFYGHGSTLGCLPCNCHQTGSTNPQCTEEGQCPCVDSVGGRQCDQCRPGFFAFGTGGCSPCGCDLAGSLNGTCDQTFGTCQCKENVEGTRCDVCKAGYFNLAASNPSGCQPCFCFQHGTVCTSATGFIYDTITSESSVNWNVTDTHFLAPPQFLGDQHVSYGQLLSFYFTGALPFGQVANATLVILEGDQEQSGSVKYVVDALTPATSTSGQVDVRFLAGEWRRADDTNAEESEMLRILADLTALKLPRQLGGTSFAYTDIVMETALAGSEGNVSTYVENCTCDAVSAVSGLSCENCSPGTRRMNVNLTSPYQVCTACDCSGRGLTTPPECDQWTGVCLNCRNGTVGDRCQSCAPFVQGAECDECEDGYWGLGPNGCEACNCSDPGSTSSLCDKDSGQCSCAPFVTGRMCERCEENYHSLSATGCQECDECYKLVMGEVTALRQLVQNMTSSVLLLETNDQTPNLGFFVPRLNDAVDTSQQLLTFLEDTTAAEDSVRGQLVTLTSLTQELSDAVTRLAENTTSDIEAVLSEALVEYENATLVKQAVTDNVQSTYDQIGTLASVVPSLDALAASLETVEAELRTRAQNSETARQAALSELQDLEQVVGQTNTLAQGTLQTVQSALGVHQNNSRRMTQLEGVDVTLNMLATETLTEGRQVRTKSAEVIQSAQGLQTAVATIGQPNIDVAGLSRSVSNVTSRADLLQAQATEADTNFASRQTEIDSAVVQTEALRSRVQALVDGVGGMTSRLTSADRQARAAEQEANSVFQSAENMLQTMQNFEVMAREVEQKTNTSLATVEDMRQASADVRAEAAAVTTSLAASQQAASQAIDIARQAKAIADMQYARLSPVAVSAQALQNSTSTELDNATAAAQRPDALLTAVVQPANETCAEQQQLVANVRSKVESAASSAQQATTRAVMATNRANLLLSNLRNIPSVDLDRIQTLLAEVNSARAQFNATELRSAIAAVQASSQAQAAKIAVLKARKAELQAKIEQLRVIQQQLLP